ncbi:sushi, von Willebrand factor type A, EGF and pentraxin domain-containing protein 1 isoform X6 [Lingula anatina]|uniref:Sushi, von Willebrand factor type A, EGF and pentraxin domain-containing protein 1 isoform X6 n=1 Tax=Lingula anatina TaxID=7574 RepID=A0A1S3J4I4_LINAN|nr:sushi, von Willebrand factor type A, EGF and pentraxin domain-containing protein 1 isoform X6 [Lingula anatina]|eukprot:XP_013405295.1 sushi, von Willebrand factor type A, EGF and pentraxin domain-containing protein 1 isoform X6 [Lingula anatina]
MGGLVRTALYACGVLLLVNFASCRKTKGSKSTIAPYKPTTKGTKGTPAEKTLSAKWSTVTCHQVSGTCSSSCGRGKVELHGIGGCITGVCCVDKDEGPCKGYCGGNCLSSKYVDKYCTQKGYVALNESVCVDSSKTCCVPSSTKAECSNKDHCGPPPVVANAETSSTLSSAHGSVLRYQCKSGFADKAESSRFYRYKHRGAYYCRDGAWISYMPINCQQICQKPPTLANAVVSGAPLSAANIFQDDTVTYSCKTGYAQNGGSAIRTCTNGAWKGSDIVCLRPCGPPPVVANAETSSTLSSAHGSVLRYQCKSGFVDKAEPSRYYRYRGAYYCRDGAWIGYMPINCQQICQKPPTVANAVVSGAPLTAANIFQDDTVTYSCKTGYAQNGGSAIRTCTNGAWKGSDIVCLQICQKPPTVANAVVSGTPLTAANIFQDDTVTYSCKTGYAPNGGSAVRTCTNGAWEGKDIVCQQICQKPPTVANAVVSGAPLSAANIFQDDTLTYSCKTGYAQNGGSAVRTCTNGAWKGKDIVCQQICQKPPTVANAVVSGAPLSAANIFQDDTVTYSCKTGYAQNGGSAVRTCTNGAWKGKDIVCQQICQKPPTVANSVVSGAPLSAAYIFQDDTVTYSCKTGYAQNGGSAIRTCTNGAWKGTDIVCLQTCSDPRKLSKLRFLTKSTLFKEGDTVKYMCEYQPGTTAMLLCSDGAWVHSGTKCSERCPEPPTFIHATLVNNKTYVEGDQAVYVCNKGYINKDGLRTLTCVSEKWDGKGIKCTKICPQPPLYQFAQMVENASAIYSSGDSVNYKCSKGYEPSNPINVMCTDGFWVNPSNKTCKRACPTPPSIPDTTISPQIGKSVPTEGDAFTYSCASGFVSTGSEQTHVKTCRDGKWTQGSIQFQCKRTCPSPPKFNNTNLLSSPSATYVEGKTVTYRCQKGHQHSKDPAEIHLMTCSDSGVWKGSTFICKRTCTPPPSVQNTNVVMPVLPIVEGSSAYYICKGNSVQAGGSSIKTCVGGSWEGVDIICEKFCSGLPYAENADTLIDHFPDGKLKEGARIIHRCKIGYIKAEGDDTRTCTNGTWSGKTFKCEMITTRVTSPKPVSTAQMKTTTTPKTVETTDTGSGAIANDALVEEYLLG